MAKGLQAVRGMNDILPGEIARWHHLEQLLRELCASFCFQEIRFPLLEQTALFKRSIGDCTDIVEKEMYTFDDRNGDSLSLRPEGTAGCVRAGIQHGLFYNQQQRLWYFGPMYRHERPQKGRYRQFFQFGLEAVGYQSAQSDVEIIHFAYTLFNRLNLLQHVRLEINSLGTPNCRENFTKALVEYFTEHHQLLDEDSQRRLHSNPMRILDSKNPDMQQLINNAPKLADYYSDEAKAHFQQVLHLLDTLEIPYQINTRLVRGLDYYTHTVFEWVTDSLGAQGAVLSGGRYDGLVEQLGGKAAPAVGFAMGIERAIAMMELVAFPVKELIPDVFIINQGDNADVATKISAQLREQLPQLTILSQTEGGSFKNQMKKADKSSARLALIIGEQEIAEGTVGIKYLRETKEQQTIAQSELVSFLQKLLVDHV